MRILVYIRIITVGIILLVIGLFYTQIIRYTVYKKMSEENRLEIIPLMAPRGTIYDRNGKILVEDVLSFNVSITYSRIKDKDALLADLASIFNIPREEVKKKFNKARAIPYSSLDILTDISQKSAIAIEEIKSNHPGLSLRVTTKRKYTSGVSYSNLIGYLGLINRQEFDKLKEYGYKINDTVGRDGIERYYDNYLRGIHGGKQIEVDNKGREIKTIGYKAPARGHDLELTLDMDLQIYASKIMEGKRGAIIVMDPSNGEILAMVSAPGYSPEIFLDEGKWREVKAVLSDKKFPLMNRAISGTYPPGSVFKLVTATGVLETNKTTREATTTCTGIFKLGRSSFHCWRPGGHGEQNMLEAIKNSCNVYFYRMGLMLGVDNIALFAKTFGFGERTGIDLSGEYPGLLPTRKWKEETLHDRWYEGETVNFAIGQGFLLVTPIQIARMMSIFANKGDIVIPHAVKKIDTVTINTYENKKAAISDKTISIIREGLRKCVNDPTGTGMKARSEDVIVAGKTGTAQTSKGKNHGWFAGFAPFDEPKLVVVIFDEYGGMGGFYAAQTAGKIFSEAIKLRLL